MTSAASSIPAAGRSSCLTRPPRTLIRCTQAPPGLVNAASVNVTGAAFHAAGPGHGAAGDLVAQFGSLFRNPGCWRPAPYLDNSSVSALLRPSKTSPNGAHPRRTPKGFHQTHAGRLAALDLVLQARPGAVLVEAVFALTHKKVFAPRLRLSRIAPAWGGPSTCPLLLCPRGECSGAESCRRIKHVRVGFIITQQDVVKAAAIPSISVCSSSSASAVAVMVVSTGDTRATRTAVFGARPVLQ